MKKSLLSCLFTATVILSTLTSPDANADCLNSEISGKGRPVLLMPGFISDQSVWQEVANALSANYQVHQLSIAGFGKNSACAHATTIVKNVNKELAVYVRENHLNNAIFVGHSMGGLMAFNLSLNKNVKLAGAISVDGLPFIGPIFTRDNATTSHDLKPQATAIKSMYQQADSAQLAAMTKQGLRIQTNQKSRYQDIIDMAKQSDPTTAASAIYSVMTTDLRPKMAMLNNPVLLIGSSGGFSSQAQHKAVESLYRDQIKTATNASLVMNTKGRHFLMWDQADWLITTIEQFIGANQ
ncbi:MAG: alpha/beta hydrolase [Psychrobium sp.]|nr:alpha/beta hydrolase [Psychrobium sp.]